MDCKWHRNTVNGIFPANKDGYLKACLQCSNKCAVILSFLETYTGLALNSVFMILKHSSITGR